MGEIQSGLMLHVICRALLRFRLVAVGLISFWVILRGLRFSHMSADLQRRFKELAQGDRVYGGGKLATQNDLCALFTVRAVALYLRSAGRIAFVLPMAALTRGQFERLRSGSFESGKIQWDEVWTMDDSVQPLFPVPSTVVFGRRRATSRAMPQIVRAYSGRLPFRDATEETANARLHVTDNAPIPEEASFTGGSVYRKSFKQGATLVPRMLCLVERNQTGRLGADSSAPPVSSRRNSQEKAPWKELAGIENRVEEEFLHPVLLGESILPYRIFNTLEGVVPVTESGEILSAKAALERGFDHLAGWMRKAEKVWDDNRSSNMSLIEQFDYYGKLVSQFPKTKLRIVYAASGTVPAACLLRNSLAIIEHGIYWASASTVGEAHFLLAILNSEAARAKAAPQQARGQWGARHFDKVMFNLPIPRFDSKIKLHHDLATVAAKAEKIAARVDLLEKAKFQQARGAVRHALIEDGISGTIDELVSRLLDSEN